MSRSMNKAMLIGNLAADPTIATMTNGEKVANLRVITNESWKDKATGERRERSEGHNIVIYNEQLVGVAEQYFHKGDLVLIEGQITNRKYTDKDGAEKYISEIVLQKYRGEMQNLTSKKESDERNGGGSSDYQSRGGDDRGTGSRDGGGRDSGGRDNGARDNGGARGGYQDNRGGRDDSRRDDRNSGSRGGNNSSRANDDLNDDVPF